jgi:hypothetical protein
VDRDFDQSQRQVRAVAPEGLPVVSCADGAGVDWKYPLQYKRMYRSPFRRPDFAGFCERGAPGGGESLPLRHTDGKSLSFLNLLWKQKVGAARVVHMGGTHDLADDAPLEASQDRTLLAAQTRS